MRYVTLPALDLSDLVPLREWLLRQAGGVLANVHAHSDNRAAFLYALDVVRLAMGPGADEALLYAAGQEDDGSDIYPGYAAWAVGLHSVVAQRALERDEENNTVRLRLAFADVLRGWRPAEDHDNNNEASCD